MPLTLSKFPLVEAADTLGITITKKPDGMYYFSSRIRGNFSENENLCQQVPGFDLPVIITQQQYDVAKGFIETELGRSKNFSSLSCMVDGTHRFDNLVFMNRF